MKISNIALTQGLIREWAAQGYTSGNGYISTTQRVETYGSRLRVVLDFFKLGDHQTTVYGYNSTADRNADIDRPVNVGSIVYGETNGPLAFWSGSGWTVDAFSVATELRLALLSIANGVDAFARTPLYETLEDYSDRSLVIDPDGKIVSFLPDSRFSEVNSQSFEALGSYKDRVIFTDLRGRVIGALPDPALNELSSYTYETLEDYANQAVMVTDDKRVLPVFAPASSPVPVLHPTSDLWRLRMTRMKTQSLIALAGGQQANIPADTQFCYCVIGDSYAAGPVFNEPLARGLRALLGNAGGGFVGLRPAPSSPHAVSGEYAVTLTGAWTDISNSLPTPDMGAASSSTAGNKLTATGPATPAISAIKLHYAPTSDGLARYRWNGGAWSDLDLRGSDPSAVATLTGFPASGAWTLEIEVVSGTIKPAGFDIRGAVRGVRANKLGQSGSSAQGWSQQVVKSQWQAAVRSLDPDLFIIMLSANDQPVSTPAAIAGYIKTIVLACRAAVPGRDVLVMQQPENQLGRATRMTSITSAVRTMCKAQGVAFLDHQYFWGDTPEEYSATSSRNWMPDNLHPDPVYGGPAIAAATQRSLLDSI